MLHGVNQGRGHNSTQQDLEWLYSRGKNGDQAAMMTFSCWSRVFGSSPHSIQQSSIPATSFPVQGVSVPMPVPMGMMRNVNDRSRYGIPIQTIQSNQGAAMMMPANMQFAQSFVEPSQPRIQQSSTSIPLNPLPFFRAWHYYQHFACLNCLRKKYFAKRS
jgi:hypothetical protein